MTVPRNQPLTYWDYLKLDVLLDLQHARSRPPEHDEMLFIVIHQVYELWFRLLLHEMDKVKRDLEQGDLYAAIHTFQRARTVIKTLVQQVDVLETMTPMSFTSFRDRLDTASGFQSAQFRELEFLLGYKRPETMQYQSESSPRRAEVERRLREPSVMDAFYVFMRKRGAAIPNPLPAERERSATQPDAQVQDALYHFYKHDPDVAILLELMTDLDEGFQEWRYRHVKLVERTIGAKHGTGGSLGVAFLKESLFKPAFPDLWAIRHRL